MMSFKDKRPDEHHMKTVRKEHVKRHDIRQTETIFIISLFIIMCVPLFGQSKSACAGEIVQHRQETQLLSYTFIKLVEVSLGATKMI